MAENQPVMLTPEQFLRTTRPKSVPVVTGQSITPGNTTTIQLPQTGLGNTLFVRVSGTVTVAGTVTSGTFKGYPNNWPFGLVKRMQLSSNNGLLMRDLSGWSWYSWVRNRYGIDPMSSEGTAYQSSGNEQLIGLNSTDRIVGGANVAAKTYKVDFMLPLPLAYNRSGDIGLIVLQQNSVFYNLSFDWSNIGSGISATGGSNDLFNTLVGTDLVITSDLRASVELDWFEVVPGIGQLVSMFMSCRDQMVPTVNVGRNQIYLPKDDYFTTIIAQPFNNGSPIATTNLQNFALEHSGNVVVYQEDGPLNVARTYYEHRLPPPDGQLILDFGLRRGTPDRRDTYDAFDNTLVTNALIRYDVPGSVTISGFNATNVIWETLRFFQQ